VKQGNPSSAVFSIHGLQAVRGPAFAGTRGGAGQHLIEGAAERINVSAGIRGVPSRCSGAIYAGVPTPYGCR
jgi:hypothetical protein